MRRRLIYFSISLFCFILCVIIVISFSYNPVIRGFLGDIIVMGLIFYFLKGIYDFNSVKLAVATLMLAFSIELLQFLHIADKLGLGDNLFVRLVFGSVFDPMDIAAYTVGGIAACLIDTRIIKKLN